MNTISYRDLKSLYTDNEDAKALAKRVFADTQPRIYETGFYSSPSWNWGYRIGIVSVTELASNGESELDTIKYYEVVTQFEGVKAARQIYIPDVQHTALRNK
jgi:hypothetical protein